MSDPALRALIVEDESGAREYLQRLVEASELARVVASVERVEDASRILDLQPLEVVFVDVNLGGAGEDGLSLIRRHRSTTGPCFVLATAVRDHALDAFTLGVVDYLLKPFHEQRVRDCLARIIERIPARAAMPRAPTRVVARSKRNLVFLDLDEVWAFESSDRLTFVHSARGPLDLDLSLAAVEHHHGDRFIRVHRRWLVSRKFIQELERDAGDASLSVGAVEGPRIKVPIARDRALMLRTWLLEDTLGIRRR